MSQTRNLPLGICILYAYLLCGIILLYLFAAVVVIIIIIIILPHVMFEKHGIPPIPGLSGILGRQ